MKTIFKQTLLITLSLGILYGCSQKQIIFQEGVVVADEGFRLTRPVKVNSSQNLNSPTKKLSAFPPTLVMSAGDKIKINIQGGKQFSGLFTVDIDGYLKLPYLQPIYANGSTIQEINQRLRDTLEMEQIL